MTGDRGQTGFDFLVGTSVFLITVIMIIAFLPGMFQPFSGETGSQMVVADRTAASLAEHLLASSAGSPGVLDETCTEDFFDGNGVAATCPFEAGSDDLHTALGVRSTVFLNVTIEDDGSNYSLNGTTLAAGGDPNPAGETTVAKRVVDLDGSERTLYVRVW